MGSEEGARVFLDNNDVVQEIYVDEEELPDNDDDENGEVQGLEADMGGGSLEIDDDSDHVFSGHTVACSPTDVGLVATGGGDDIGFIWRIGEGISPQELKGHSDSIVSLAFSTDGQLLATGGMDGVVIIWDIVTGNLKHKLEGPGEAIEWVKWHPRGHLILAGSDDFTAWLWNSDSGACLNVFSGHSGPVSCGDFTPDGKSICTGGGDGSLRIWNPKSGESTRVVQGHPYHTQGVLCLAIHSDSSFAITGSEDSTACVVNLQTGRISGSLAGHTKSVECVGLSSMLPLAATGGMDGNLIIWDLQSLTPRSTCEHEDGVVKLIWPSSSHLIYTSCLDAKVRVWDSRSGDLQRTFQGHEDSIMDMALSKNPYRGKGHVLLCRDGRFIVSGSDDCTARAFDCKYPS